jgi:hypothetical protein
MRFYGEQRGFYCGIDLHASKMYVCVLDEHGNVVLHRNLRTEPEALKRALAHPTGRASERCLARSCRAPPATSDSR